MSTIDLVVLGLIKQHPQGAYDIQKELANRNISQWVRVSVPAIYKKVIQLEEKGYIESTITKTGKMPEKAVYHLTESGESYFIELMEKISEKSIKMYLDINSIILNLENIPLELRYTCLEHIEKNILALKEMIESNISMKTDIPYTGKSILKQQHMLSLVLLEWIKELKNNTKENLDAKH